MKDGKKKEKIIALAGLIGGLLAVDLGYLFSRQAVSQPAHIYQEMKSQKIKVGLSHLKHTKMKDFLC